MTEAELVNLIKVLDKSGMGKIEVKVIVKREDRKFVIKTIVEEI